MKKFLLLIFVCFYLQSFSQIVNVIDPYTSYPSVSDWYDSNWQYRVKVTIQSTEVDETITNYPAYVDLSDLPAGFHTNVKSDGGDIRVTTSDKITEIPREIVFYDSGTDTGEIHFKGDISSTTNTDFYIYYGNAAASDYAVTDTYGRNNVWNSNYKAVYHLNEAVNNDVDGYKDSSGNGNDGTGESMALTEQTGKLAGNAADFDGSSDLIRMGTVSDLGISETDITFSLWINSGSLSGRRTFFATRDAGSSDFVISGRTDGTQIDIFIAQLGNLGYIDIINVGSLSTNTWYNIQFTYDRANKSGFVYLDGVLLGSDSFTEAQPALTVENYATIGAFSPNSDNYDGLIDEFRLLNTNVSAEFMTTQYNNQNSPNTFYAIGNEESN